jgi:hypothetical protein
MRAAFEAAQDALLLVTAPDYLAAGALARVFERIAFAELAREMHAMHATSSDGASWKPVSLAAVAASVEADAQRLDQSGGDAGVAMRNALAELLPKFQAARMPGKKRAKYPSHWSGLSRRGIGRELNRRRPDLVTAETQVAVYAYLSRYAHPSFGRENWRVSLDDKGNPILARTGELPRTAAGTALVAVGVGIKALELREQLGKGASQ